MQIIENIISKNKLDFEHPFIVALCDAVQSQGFRFFYDNDYIFEDAAEDLRIALEHIINPKAGVMNRVRSLALFKAHVANIND